MNRDEILTILFLVRDEVVRLRSTIGDVSEHLHDEERTKLLAALDRIERHNAKLIDKVQARLGGPEH